MSSELRAQLWVQALIRRAEVGGASAFVTKRGDGDAGAVLIKVARLDGTARLLSPARDGGGERIFLDLTGKAAGPDEPSIDAYLQRSASRDSDIWIIEIEDKQGRDFLTERVD
jgi:hypothetical protein